jgi:hypothetical protein
MDLLNLIVTIVLFLLTGCSGVIWWFTTYTIKSVKTDIVTLQAEIENWKNITFMENNNINIAISRLDTLAEERLDDIKEMKNILSDLQKRFVCKDDLRSAITELKQLIRPN